MSTEYMVTLTDSGQWLHAPGSDFLFAYVDNEWPDALKTKVGAAFVSALGMSSKIKAEVLKTSGQAVVNGLYLLDHASMTMAMNQIDGMGETEADQNSQSGQGTVVQINGEFFSAALAGLGGDVAPLLGYLTQAMGNLQAQVGKHKGIDNFGTVMGLISAIPELDAVVTTFQYVFSSQSTSQWFVKLNCGSVEKYSYDYSYTVVKYNYSAPASVKADISFGSALGYQNPFVTLTAGRHAIEVTLQDGTHTVTSDPVTLGALPGFERRPLEGHLTFTYSYDSQNRTVTVAGSDVDSPDAMCLVTAPKGTSERCYQRAADSGGFRSDDLLTNPGWNYRTPLTPGLEDVLKGMVREANASLIAALKAVPGLTVRVRTNPPEVSAEDYRNLLAVYRHGTFHGLYEPGVALGPDDTVHTIESTWGGEVTFDRNEAFANVIGSTHDPKIAGKSWIELWRGQFGPANICTSYSYPANFCGPGLLGGHVITGTVAQKVPAGSDAVYILPICSAHNNNDNVYGKAIQYQQGIWLRNYLGW